MKEEIQGIAPPTISFRFILSLRKQAGAWGTVFGFDVSF